MHREASRLDCKTVFYSARKTSLCERAVKRSFSQLSLNLKEISFAVDKNSLCKALTTAFRECNIVFVIGGLCLDGERGIENVISHLVKASCVDECKRLKNPLGDDGFVIRAQSQLLVLLPDEPEQIEAIMQGAISGYIKAVPCYN